MGWPDWFIDVGRILAVCLQDLSSIRPADPFEYMAQWLYRYADSEQYRLEKMEYLKKLKEAYKELKHSQLARRRRIDDYKAKIETFKKELCDFEGPLTIMDFLRQRDLELKQRLQEAQEDRYEMDLEYHRPGARENIFSLGVQPPLAMPPLAVIPTVKASFDPAMMVKKGSYYPSQAEPRKGSDEVEGLDTEADDLFLGDKEDHDDYDKKRMLGDYYKKRMTGEIDPFSRDSKRHMTLPIPDRKSGAPWEDFVHGSIGQPFRKPASVDLVDKVYVDPKGRLRRAIDNKRVSVDPTVKAPDGFVAFDDGMVIPVSNIRAKKPEDDPDFPRVSMQPGQFGRGMGFGGPGMSGKAGYPGMPGYSGQYGYGTDEGGAGRGRRGSRYDDEGRYKLGERRSSEARRRKRYSDGSVSERFKPEIAQWYLEDDAKHLKCEHPVLGRLGVVLRVELPPEWFDRDFSCRTFYQHEIYTICAEDGVRLLDLQPPDK